MFNPLRNEADAYRLVLGTVGYFALVAIASVTNRWLGLAVFAGLTLGIVVWFLRARRREPPLREHAERRSAPGEHRILVIANETVGGSALQRAIHARAEETEERVLVVCPALNSPLRHWASDEDPARAEAQRRLDRSLGALANLGVRVDGQVGDAEPLQAIEDAVRTFGPDEIIISTHPEGRSHWLERGIVTAARERFDLPVTHVVVDLEEEATSSSSGGATSPRSG